MAINAWSFTIPSMESEEPEKDEWENQLWADRHKPIDPNDLCIPSRKVNDVERIIRGSSIYNSHSKLKVLLLTGKTGTGKSTMIKLLAQKMDIQIIEWEAEHRIKNDPDYVSTMERFEDFMHGTILRQTLNQNNRKKMILLDDIPDLTSSLIKDRFHEILTRYILDRHPFFMVITISEATSDSVSSTYNSTETRMTQAHDVLPDSLTDSSFVRNITINPVTAATMKKKLANIIKKEHSSARDSDRDAIIDMAEGDLRIAINHLQFYFPPGRKGSQNPISEEIKMGSNPLTLFHALGKVLYAKRNPDNTLESKPELAN
ncbi:Rad17-domain-containing protein [Backusella circina FSU 941]|nr:Rad17-domain-containing protein [Backusella circina FSU 941]